MPPVTFWAADRKFHLVKSTALWTTVAHPHRQFCKLGNGCILVINFFNKHSIVKMYLVKVVSLSGFHLKYLIKSLIFKIFFSACFALCLHLHIYIYRVRDRVASSVLITFVAHLYPPRYSLTLVRLLPLVIDHNPG